MAPTTVFNVPLYVCATLVKLRSFALLKQRFHRGFYDRKLKAGASRIAHIFKLLQRCYAVGVHEHSKLNDFYPLRMVRKPSAKRIVLHRLGVKIALRHMAAE